MAINKKLIFWNNSSFNPPTSSTDTTQDVLWNTIVFFGPNSGHQKEIWTHGVYFSSPIWGTETADYVPVTISGVTKNLSLNGHTHSYLPLNGGTITGSISVSESITNLSHNGGGIFWNPYAESDTDPSDVASISVNTSGGSTVMTIKQLNDANDYVNFVVGASDGVRVNGNVMYHSGNIPTWNQNTTGNAATATTFSTNRSNYRGVTDDSVAGQLMWKNYGNNHTIFDASSSTTPSNTSCNNTNSAIAWSASYPTLMGWNGSSTYGVRVDSARLADSATNADKLDGQEGAYYHNNVGNIDFATTFPAGYTINSETTATTNPYSITGGNQATILQVIPTNNMYGAQFAIGFGTAYPAWRSHQNSSTWSPWQKISAGYADNAGLLNNMSATTSATANTIVQRDVNGYIYCCYINCNRGDETSAAASYVYDSGDGWLRKKTLANAQAELVTKAQIESVLTGNITSHTHSFINSTDSRYIVTTPETINRGLTLDFKASSTEGLIGEGEWMGELTYRTYGLDTDWSGGPSHQLAFAGTGNLWHRIGSSTTWNSWYKIWDSNNSNLTTIPWSVSSLTMNGALTGATIGRFSGLLSTDYNGVNAGFRGNWGGSNYWGIGGTAHTVRVGMTDSTGIYQTAPGDLVLQVDGSVSSSGFTKSGSSDSYVLLGGGGHAIISGLNVATASVASQIISTVSGTNSIELVRGNMADNDQFRILVGGTASDEGYVEIATADNATEPIYVRQYVGEFEHVARSATLLDASGNTSFPGSVTASSFIGNALSASNADMLDGYHFSNFFIAAGELEGLSGTVAEKKAELVTYFNNYPNGIGANAIVSTSLIENWNNDTALLYPTSVYSMIKIGGGYAGTVYGQWLLSSYNLTNVGIVGRDNSVWSDIKWLAFTTDNVASATKLQTAHSIWGQSFDGTSDISGQIDLGGHCNLPAIRFRPIINGYDTAIGYDSAGVESLAFMAKAAGTTFKFKSGYDPASFTITSFVNMTNADLEIGNGYAKINGNSVWHAGNDGSGSGLDADLLDGQQGTYYDQRVYNSTLNYLGGGYNDGGNEKPNWAGFGPGKLKLQMLYGGNIGAPDAWNDVLWMSSYNCGDVKGSNILIFSKYNDRVGFARQSYDSPTWGTYREFYHTGNSNLSSIDWNCNNLYAGDVLSDNNFTQHIASNRFGGWARGLLWKTNDLSTLLGGVYMYGSYLSSNYINIAHGDYNSINGICILPNGNVGMGNTSPGYRLDVNGNANISGALFATSFSGVLNVIYSDECVLHYGIAGGRPAWINYRGSSGTGISSYLFGNGLGNGGYSNVVANIFYGSLSGNAATASRVANTGISSSWLSGRDNAIVKQTTVNGYSVVMSTKTNNGSWELGNYSDYGDQLLLSYFSDTNYNAGANSVAAQYQFSTTKCGTVAVMADLPTSLPLLSNLFGSRPTDANITQTGSGGLSTFKATYLMTSNKPASDGHIIHMYWDNTGGYDSQLFVSEGETNYMQYRNSNAGTWGSWITLLDSLNYKTYTVDKTGTGATGTWNININGSAQTLSNVINGYTGTYGLTVNVSGTLYTNSNLTYNGTTNTLTSPNFAGNLLGTASNATNISNTGTVTLASATESNAITITQPSYTTDQPVKLLNFNWYTDAWSIGNIRSGGIASSGLGVYLNSVEKFRFINGVFKIGTNTAYHAGNFSVTLNGTSTTSASFYAPTSQLSVQSSIQSYLIGASSTTSLGTVYSNAGIYMNGSKLYTGDIQASGNITASNLWGIATKDVSLTLTTDWQDTGILMNDSTLFASGSGTYVIELYSDTPGVSAQYAMRYSGVMAVYTSQTNNITDTDEITLHSMGHASNARQIYLRTALQVTPNYAKIQIASSAAWTGAGTITIKTRRII